MRPPRTGEPVSEGVAGRGHQDGYQRSQHLKERLEEMEAGQVLVRYDQSVEVGLLPGRPVFLDDDGVWKAAVAEAGDEGAIFALTKRGAALGALLRVTSTGTGDILLSGSATIAEADLEAACAPQALQEGPFWLGSVSGISFVPAGISILLGYLKQVGSEWHLFWHGAPSGTLFDHVHKRIELAPIMTWTSVPGDSFPGSAWLDASDTLFDGLVQPPFARYGYVIEDHDELSACWPPIPTDTAMILADGVDVTNSKVIVNEDGIWWMDSGTEPTDFDRLSLLLTQYGSGSPAIVASMGSATPMAVFKDRDGAVASVGHLKFNLVNPTETEDLSSSTVLRSIDFAAGTAKTGKAVSRIRAGGGVTVTGEDAGDGYKTGDVVVVGNGSLARDLAVEVVSLDRAEERIYAGHTMLVFIANTLSGVRGTFRVDDIPGTLSVRIGIVMASLWGTVTVDTSAPVLGVRIIPAATDEPATLPVGSDTVVALTGPATIGNGEYALLTSEAISVEAGDIVQFSLTRGDTAGNFGVLQFRPMLTVS